MEQNHVYTGDSLLLKTLFQGKCFIVTIYEGIKGSKRKLSDIQSQDSEADYSASTSDVTINVEGKKHTNSELYKLIIYFGLKIYFYILRNYL